MRVASLGLSLALASLLAVPSKAEDRLAPELDRALSRLAAAGTRGHAGEQYLAPLRPLLRELQERHARREREFDRISRLNLPPKARERLSRARAAHRTATLPVIEALRGLLDPEPPAAGRTRALANPARHLESLGEARAILGRMAASSRPRPISADVLSVHAPILTPPALGQPTGGTTSSPAAHVPQSLKDLAAGLASPVEAYRWVRNTVASEFYYGAMKGAVETQLEASGNDADTASLLVQLLRAQGVAARYSRGTVEVPGATLAAVCGTASVEQAVRVLERGGVPHEVVTGAGGIAAVKLERIWVEAYLPYANYRGTLLDRQGGAWIPLDPGFKRLGPPNTLDVTAELGFDADAVWQEYLAAPRDSSPLDLIRARVGTLLTEKAAGLHYDAVLNARDVVPEALGILPNSLPYKVLSVTEVSYDIPRVLTHAVRFVALRDGATVMDATFVVPELLGRRLTLAYRPFSAEDEATVATFGGLAKTPPYLFDVKATLRLGGVPIAAADAPLGMGVPFSFRMEFQTPGGAEPIENELIAGNLTAIGLSGRQVTASETTQDQAASLLADLAWSYFQRWNDSDDELARLLKVVAVRPTVSACLVASALDVDYAGGDPLYPLTFVRKGILIDADLRSSAPVGLASRDAERPFTLLSGLAGSVLEHAVFEDRYEIPSVSTAKALQVAAAQGVAILEVTAANADEVTAGLPFDQQVLAEVRTAAGRGWSVRIPAAPVSYNLWNGVGYLLLDHETGEAAYQLQGGYSGGLTTLPLSSAVQTKLDDQGEIVDTTPAGEVARLIKAAASDYQEGIVAKQVPDPLKALVTDADGNPVKDAAVTFIVQGGGGTLVNLVTGEQATQITALTDATGAAQVGLQLGEHTGLVPAFTCEAGITCCTEGTTCTDGTGLATQVGVNQVTAVSGGVALDEPFRAFALPDRQCDDKSCHGVGRLVYSAASGYAPNMRVVGPVVWLVSDQHGNPLSNIPATLTYQSPPVLDDPANVGARSRCRNEVPGDSSTPGGVLNAAEYELCAIRTPVRKSDCPGAPSVTSSTSAYGVAFYPVVGGSPYSSYHYVVSDEEGKPQLTLTYHTWGNLCGAADPSACACSEPGVFPSFVERSTRINTGGNVIEAYPPGGVAKTGFGTDVVYEKESIRQVLDAQGVPHFFAFGTNEWLREPLDDSTIEVVPTTSGTHATEVLAKGSGQYQGEMRMAPEPQLNSLSYKYKLYPPMVPYLPEVSPGVAPPAGTRHEVDPSFVVPGWLSLRERIKVPSQPWTGQGTFSLWGAKLQLTEVKPAVRVSPAGAVLKDSVVSGDVAPVALGDLLDTRRASTELRQGNKVFQAEHAVGMRIAEGSLLPVGEYAAVASIGGVTPDGQPMVSDPLPVVASLSCDLLTTPTRNLTVSTTHNPWTGTQCDNGDTLRFTLCEDAKVTLTIGGRTVRTESFAAGERTFVVSPSDLLGASPADPRQTREFGYVLSAQAARDPSSVAAVSGTIALETPCNRPVLPVGRTFVKGVDLLDGHVVRQATDLKALGRHLGLEVTRTYSSSGESPQGLMGAGWSFSYEPGLILSSCGLVAVRTADGSSQVFRSPDNGATYQPQPGYHTKLDRNNDGSFDFYDKAHVRHHFEAGLASRRRLLEVREPHGDRLLLTYHPTNVERLLEVAEVPRGETVPVRRLKIVYTDDPDRPAGARSQPGGFLRVASVSIPELRLEASYSYDAFGNLVRVTRRGLNLEAAGGRDAEPTEERYEYTTGNPRDRHQLVAAVDANGHRTEYVPFQAQDPFPGEADGLLVVQDKEEYVRIVREYPSPNAPIETSFVYDAHEALTKLRWQTTVTDARGQQTLYVLNPNGSPVEIREPLGKTTAMRWAVQDIYKEWERDARGRETDFSHDARGNLIRETIHTADPTIAGAAPNGDVTTSYAYDPVFNKLTSKTDGLGRTTSYTIDGEPSEPGREAAGDLTDVLDAAQNHTHHEYDEVGRLTQTTDPRGYVTRFSDWDSFGNARRIDGPGSYWKQRQYDERGRLVREWDSLGHETQTAYDGFDRVVEQRRLSGRNADEVTRTWYYPDGQPSAVMNALGAETAYTLDGLDRVVLAQTTVPGGTSFEIVTAYDANGNKESEVDARRITRKHTYDALNRLAKTEIAGGLSGEGPVGPVAAYGYDLVGNKLWETDVNSLTTRFEYDGLDRLSKKVFPQVKPSGGNYEEGYAHDAVGNPTRLVDANGKVTESTYDGLNRVLRVTRDVGGLALVTTTTYDDPEGSGSHVNKSQELDLAKGLRTSYLYDALNRETNRSVALEGAGGSGEIYVTTSAYDDAQHAVRITDPRGVVSVRALDGLDRVVEETVDVEGLGGSQALALRTSVVYDGLGNKKEIEDSEGRKTRHSYDGLGRLMTTTDAKGQESRYSYLPDGLKESETDRRGVKKLFAYDNLDRLRKTWLDAAPFSGVSWSQETQYLDRPEPRRVETDARGKATISDFDGMGRLIKETDALGHYRTFTWDGVNKVEETDKRHHATQFAHDGINRLTKTTDPLAQVVTILYDDRQNQVVETDKRGIAKRTQLDPLGRVRSVARAVGTPDEALVERNSYDGNGNRLSTTDAEEKVTSFAYDAANRLASRTDGLGTGDAGTTTYKHDKVGNVVEERDARAAANGAAWSAQRTYDELNRLRSEADGEGNTSTYEYDPEGHRASIQTPKGPTTAFLYDELGKLIRVTQPPPEADAASPVTEYRYDENRNRIRQTDANGHVVAMEYDDIGRLRKTVQDPRTPSSPDGLDLTTETLQFDDDGNPLVVRDPKGQTITSEFDSLSRLKTKSYAFAPGDAVRPWRHTTLVAYTYDANNNLLRQDETVASGADPPGLTSSIVRSYDSLDRLETETVVLERGDPALLPVSKTLTHSYWKNGLRKTTRDPESAVTSYTYDGRNRLKTVTTALGESVYTYYEDGLLKTLTEPDGSLASYGYDKADRLLSLEHAKGQRPIASYAYTYDANGNRLSQLETNGGPAETTRYGYDDLDRLSAITYPTDATYTQGRVVTYGYDAVGNRIRETVQDASDPPALLADKQGVFDNANRPTRLEDLQDPANTTLFGWDPNGNQISKAVGTGDRAVTRYVYDIRDKLVEVQTAASLDGDATGIAARYQYDAEGRLLKKVGEGAPGDTVRQYVHDQTSRLLEYDGSGATVVARFSYGADRLLSMWHLGEGTRFYHLDGLRSVVALTDTTGAVTANLRLDTWGNFRFPETDLSTSANRFAFTGHVWEPEIGLYYAKARFLDPKLGRFITQDSFLGDIDEPPSLHRYVYAEENPTTYLDLTGNARIKAKDVADFVGAACYTFLYDVVPGSEFVGGKPEEFVQSSADYEGAGFGHSAALALGVVEVKAGIGTGWAAAGVGGASAAVGFVPGGQVVTAVGVPAAVVVAAGATTEVALGGYTVYKAVRGQERLKQKTPDGVVKENTPKPGEASPTTTEPLPADKAKAKAKRAETVAKSRSEGARRERETHAELKQEHPDASVQRERYLRDAEGRVVRDPKTGEGRRIDHVVIKEKKVIRSVETTSLTADKAEQTAKEGRVREAGGTFVRDKETREIVPVPEEVTTEVKRRP
jgi:RHS repeat-associated protein